MQDFGLQVSLVFFACSVVFALWQMERKLNNLAMLLTHYLKDTTRCPECDYPAIGASFCEDTSYICPQCGEKFMWKLRHGKYVLSANIEGDPHE